MLSLKLTKLPNTYQIIIQINFHTLQHNTYTESLFNHLIILICVVAKAKKMQVTVNVYGQEGDRRRGGDDE